MSSVVSAAKEAFDSGVAALSRADLAPAKAAFLQCVALAPDFADGWCYLGMTLALRDHAEAAKALDQALALDPRHLGALYWRAETEWVEGCPAAAAGYLKRLNDIVPDSSQNLARLGLAYLAAEDFESASGVLRRAVNAGGGVDSAIASPPELRRAIYLELLQRHDEATRLIDVVNGQGPAAAVPSARYPRNLEEQRCALENVAAGRDIVILGSGPSLGQLQPVLAELGARGCERLCFFGFNNVPVAERMLQETIGRGVDLACMTSASVSELHLSWIRNFLERDSSPNLFLTSKDAVPPGSAVEAALNALPERLFYFATSGDYPPIPGDPLHFPPVNTLMCVLPLAVLAQPRRIFMFGCDGIAPASIKGGAPVYFQQGSDEYGDQPVPQPEIYAKWLARDTFFFNTHVTTVLGCLAVLHSIEVPPIHTCNPDSAYRPFPRISAQEFKRLVERPAETQRFFPARISQVKRRLEARLNEVTARAAAAEKARDLQISDLARELEVHREQLAKVKRVAGPLLELRRRLLRLFR